MDNFQIREGGGGFGEKEGCGVFEAGVNTSVLTMYRKLVCSHEKDNPYDFFTIKVVDSWSSTNRKFKNDKVYSRQVSANICDFDVNQLLQITSCSGSLGNACSIEIHTPSTVKNKQPVQIYETLLILFTTNVKKSILSVLPSRAMWKLKVATGRRTIKSVIQKT